MTVVDLRQPTAALALLGLSYVFLAGILVAVFSSRPDALTGTVFTAGAVGITVVNTARGLSRARTTPEGALLVRNSFRTRTVHRADVDRVVAGRAGGPGTARAVRLLLRDGSMLPVLATAAGLWPGGKVRTEAQAEELRAWAAGR